MARLLRWLFGLRAPLELPTAREHAAMMRLLDRRVREAQRLSEEIAAWPAPLTVIEYACGTGPAVVYPAPPRLAPPPPAPGLGGFGITMEELAEGMAAICAAVGAGREAFADLTDAVVTSA